MTEENKVKYGLKNVHYATYSEINGAVVFNTPVAIPGAVSYKASAAGDELEFYADDGLYYGENTNNGYDGELEIALVPQSFEIDVLGKHLDANGVLVEKSSQKGNPFALLYEFTGDIYAKRHVLYNCTASRVDMEGATKADKKDVKPEKFTFKARPISGTEEVHAASTTTTDAGAYAAWYTTVYREDATVIPVTAIAVAGAGAVESIVEGNTLAMIAAITPANASDPRVVWSVATLLNGVATINPLTGILTAVTDGTVTVTATNEASGVTGTEVITITNPA